MLSVDAAGLEVLVFAIGGTLPVVAIVVTTTAIVVVLALLASAMLTTMAATIALILQPVAPTLVGEKTLLMPYSFLQLGRSSRFASAQIFLI